MAKGLYKKLIRELKKQGFEVEHEGGHYAVRKPGKSGRVGTLPSTASDHRSFQNSISQLRNTIGFDDSAFKNVTPKTIYTSVWAEQKLPQIVREVKAFLDSQTQDIEDFAREEAGDRSIGRTIAKAHREKGEEVIDTLTKLEDALDDELSRKEDTEARKAAYLKLEAISDKVEEAGKVFRRNKDYELTGEICLDTARYVDNIAQRIRSES